MFYFVKSTNGNKWEDSGINKNIKKESKMKYVVTIEELCEILHIKPSKAYKLREQNKIAWLKDGKGYVFPIKAVEEYIERQSNENIT